MILLFYFQHAPVSAKHFYSLFKVSVCNFLRPDFLFYCRHLHCVSAETCLRNLQGIKPGNHLIRCRWSTKQQQTLYAVYFLVILIQDDKYCLNKAMKKNAAHVASLRLTSMHLGSRIAKLFCCRNGLFYTEERNRNELKRNFPCS